MSFAADVRRFAELTGIKAQTLVRKIAFEALKGVVMKSPVDTGRFRANWRVAINRVNKGAAVFKSGGKASLQPNYPDNALRHANAQIAGAGPFAEGAKQFVNVQVGDSIYITNNLSYAKKLEDGGSKQAANGMLKITVAQIKADMRRMVGEAEALAKGAA